MFLLIDHRSCMPDELKVVQISDPHLRADPDAVLHGWHVDHAWRRVRDDAMTRHPDADLWALTGDLVDDETEAGYQRLNQQLAAVQCPVLALAGNHDDPHTMQACLRRARVHAGLNLGGWQLRALNSHVDGSEAGRLGRRQMAQLRSELTANPQPAVLFIHHPPIGIDSNWIDGIGLSDRAEMQHLIHDQPHVAAVICGHAHQAFETHIGQAMCWITPSTMRQFRPGAQTFALDETVSPGYRVIELQSGGRIRSHVQRVPACG